MLQRNFTVNVKLLSELHIGTGTKLAEDIDWIARPDGFIYIADQVEIADVIMERRQAAGEGMRSIARSITGASLRDLVERGWLRADDVQSPGKLFPYRLRGTPSTREVREQIKDVYGRPYLPGSSLKGALRTVIAGVAAAELEPDVRLSRLGRTRAWAARPTEQTLFGADPNHDFLRMVQVSDSAAGDITSLRLRRAHIYPTAAENSYGRSKGVDVDLEAVAKGTEFDLSIHLPLELLGIRDNEDQGFDQRRLAEIPEWERRKNWLSRIAVAGRTYAKQQLIEEVNYFQAKTDVPLVHGFYNRLVDQFSKLAKNQFLLRLGWGGGWHSKTISAYLRRDAANLDQIIELFKLNPMGRQNKGSGFPKSRHLLRQPDGEPGEPLGWVLVTLAVKTPTEQLTGRQLAKENIDETR